MRPFEISIAIHSSRDSEQVVEFVDIERFTESFKQLYNNNLVEGCYNDESGNIVAQDIWGEIHTDIIQDC